MGVELSIYRARIGSFCLPIKRRTSMKTLKVSSIKVRLLLRLSLFMSVLLVMGGDVEMNPGPTTGTRQPRNKQKQLSLSESFSGNDSRCERDSSFSLSQDPIKQRYMTRNNKDSEVMDFLKEMREEMKSQFSNVNSTINSLKKLVEDLKSENSELRQENESIKLELAKLNLKLDKLESHSRRNNLRFMGIKGSANESWDESERNVKHFILDTLNMPEMVDVQIERAHRIGRKRADNCPIIAKFKDRDLILRRAREVIRHSLSKRTFQRVLCVKGVSWVKSY